MFRFSHLAAFCASLPLILAQDGGNIAIDLAGKVPNANAFTNANSGINCEFLGNTECRDDTPANRFGAAFEAAGSWTVEFCNTDSDGDGLTNGEELGDPCCVWTPGANPRRTVNLSHPGLASETNTGFQCPSPSPSASVSGVAASPSVSAAAVSPSVSAAAASPSASAAATVTDADPSPSASPVSASDVTTTPGTGTGTISGTDTDSSDDTTATEEEDADGSTTTTGTTTGTTTFDDEAADPSSSPEENDNTNESGDDTDDDGSVCFPAQATVTLEDGSSKAMRDLRVGDRVQVGAGEFSDVFMFSHKLSDVKYRFVTLKAVAGARSVSLSLTKGHYVYANGRAVPAGAVRVGDSIEVMGEDSCATVTEIKSEVLSGLYNPQTVDGNIVVNGVKASTFTHTVKHTTAHSMMMPVRAMFRFFGAHLTVLEGGADTIADILPSQV